MKLVERSPDGVTIQITRDELLLLHGSMRETLEAIGDWEFSLRMGAELPDLKKLLSEFRTLIDQLDGLKEV